MSIYKSCGFLGLFPAEAESSDVQTVDDVDAMSKRCGFLGFGQEAASIADVPDGWNLDCGPNKYVHGGACVKKCAGYEKDDGSCGQLTSCEDGQYVAKSSTPSSDRQCSDVTTACPTASDDSTATILQKHATQHADIVCGATDAPCPDGQVITHAGSSTAVRQCGSGGCDDGEFLSTPGTSTLAQVCQAHRTSCTAPDVFLGPGTATSDIQCGSATACGDGTVLAVAATQAQAMVCKDPSQIEACPDGTWSTPATSTSVQQCEPVSCAAGQHLSISADNVYACEDATALSTADVAAINSRMRIQGGTSTALTNANVLPASNSLCSADFAHTTISTKLRRLETLPSGGFDWQYRLSGQNVPDATVIKNGGFCSLAVTENKSGKQSWRAHTSDGRQGVADYSQLHFDPGNAFPCQFEEGPTLAYTVSPEGPYYVAGCQADADSGSGSGSGSGS